MFQPQTKKTSSNKRPVRSSKPKSKSAISTLESSENCTPEESALRPLPDFFDSDLSESDEFWGFPPEAVVNDIQSKFTFNFQLNDRGKELFGDGDSSDIGAEFKGFTLEDLYVCRACTIPVKHTYMYSVCATMHVCICV